MSSKEIGDLARDILSQHANLRLLATGTSMIPSIQDQDTIIIEPIKSSIHLLDILLYQYDDNRLFAHRVIRIQSDHKYLMWGDDNIRPDKWISSECVLGVVTRVERNGKSLNPSSLLFKLNAISHAFQVKFRMLLKRSRKSIKDLQ